jgi:hypothetical protein
VPAFQRSAEDYQDKRGAEDAGEPDYPAWVALFWQPWQQRQRFAFDDGRTRLTDGKSSLALWGWRKRLLEHRVERRIGLGARFAPWNEDRWRSHTNGGSSGGSPGKAELFFLPKQFKDGLARRIVREFIFRA